MKIQLFMEKLLLVISNALAEYDGVQLWRTDGKVLRDS